MLVPISRYKNRSVKNSELQKKEKNEWYRGVLRSLTYQKSSKKMFSWKKKEGYSSLTWMLYSRRLNHCISNIRKHCVKSVQIRSSFWSVFCCIWVEYRKIRTRNDSVLGNFLRSERVLRLTYKGYQFSCKELLEKDDFVTVD